MISFIYTIKLIGEKILAEKYLPLYRKYRPTTFHEVVGQQVVVKTLLNAIEHNRVAHAYLFCGPRGTGKTSIARIFAKTLNCQNPQNGTPCEKCSHCLDMNNTAPLDVIEIDAASNRKVEDARNLLEKVQFTPILGKNKIYIIDEVHMLTTEAFNTLLKTLEEPPENLIFILATTEAHKVLETIVSRCQKFDFRRISVDDIKGRLKEISEKEKINIEDDAIEFIARRSAGGLRDALALLDQSTVLALDNKVITKKDIITLLGSIDDDDLYNLAELISQKNPSGVIELLKSIVDKGNDPTQLMKELIGYFRNLMLASVCKSTEEASKLLDISIENCEKMLMQAKTFSSQELAQIIEVLAEQERNIRNSSNPYLYLDVAIVNVATRENILAEKALLERIEDLENIIKTGFIPKTPAKSVNTQPVIQQVKQVEQQPTVKSEEENTAEKFVENLQENKVEKTQITQEEVMPEKTKEANSEFEKAMPTAPKQVEEKPDNISSENTSHNVIELNWDTFLGELQSNAPLWSLLRMQATPISLNSEKIELTFKLDGFIEKVKKKQDLLEEAAKKLCGTKPRMIFRKTSEADFKKKIADTPTAQQVQHVKKVQPVPDKKELKPTKEEIKEVEKATNEVLSKTEDLSKYDLPDDTRQIMEIFSGKFID